MPRHRIPVEPAIRLPRPPDAPLSPTAFLVCPVGGLPGMPVPPDAVQQQLYQAALAQALAVARPSLLERDLVGVWN